MQEKLSAAYRVLSLEDKRRAYLQYLFSRLDIGRSAELNVDAEIALSRGEAALKRKDWLGAQRSFEDAVAKNPREPEYYCHLAWATYQNRSAPKADRLRQAQKLVKKALSMNPYLEHAMVISGILDGDAGDRQGARKKLLKALELNPSSRVAKAALQRMGR